MGKIGPKLKKTSKIGPSHKKGQKTTKNGKHDKTEPHANKKKAIMLKCAHLKLIRTSEMGPFCPLFLRFHGGLCVKKSIYRAQKSPIQNPFWTPFDPPISIKNGCFLASSKRGQKSSKIYILSVLCLHYR